MLYFFTFQHGLTFSPQNYAQNSGGLDAGHTVTGNDCKCTCGVS